jgi:hypothetical protein
MIWLNEKERKVLKRKKQMAQIKTISCDNCGKQKGEANHWWSIEANIHTKSMFIHPFDELQLKIPDHIELSACGLECLGILESKIKEGRNPLAISQ